MNKNHKFIVIAIVVIIAVPIVSYFESASVASKDRTQLDSVAFENEMESMIQQFERSNDKTQLKKDQLALIIFSEGVSGCVASACVGSACAGSACGASGCAGSACSASGCAGSACGASGCIGSACAGSGCVGSACGGSVCGVSGCGGSVCGASGCSGSVCGASGCGGSVCAHCKKSKLNPKKPKRHAHRKKPHHHPHRKNKARVVGFNVEKTPQGNKISLIFSEGDSHRYRLYRISEEKKGSKTLIKEDKINTGKNKWVEFIDQNVPTGKVNYRVEVIDQFMSSNFTKPTKLASSRF